MLENEPGGQESAINYETGSYTRRGKGKKKGEKKVTKKKKKVP